MDYENYSPLVNESPYIEEPSKRPWLKMRSATVAKTIKFDPIPVHFEEKK